MVRLAVAATLSHQSDEFEPEGGSWSAGVEGLATRTNWLAMSPRSASPERLTSPSMMMSFSVAMVRSVP